MDWSYAYSRTYLGDKDFKFGLDWSFAYSTTVSVTKIWSTRGINRFRGARFVDDCQYEKEEKGPRRVALLLSDG